MDNKNYQIINKIKDKSIWEKLSVQERMLANFVIHGCKCNLSRKIEKFLSCLSEENRKLFE